MGRLHSVLEDHWGKYGAATEAAYAQAYTRQGAVLGHVKTNLEETRKRNEMIACFALSLITVAVGGPLAGSLVKKGLEKFGVDEAAKLSKDVLKFVEDHVDEPIKKGTESLYKALGSELSQDAFAPAGVSPSEYGAKLREGIFDRLIYIDETVSLLTNQPATSISVDACKNLIRRLHAHPFVQKMPDRTLSSDKLLHSAKVALWVAWGWQRDAGYWRKHSHDGASYEENRDFEPIMTELLDLGVPYLAVQQAAKMQAGGISLEGFDFGKKMINMDGFINWCMSDLMLVTLFYGLSSRPEWLDTVTTQLRARRVTFNAFGF
jgi:hypothetical protein